jgi:hypothetical protein
VRPPKTGRRQNATAEAFKVDFYFAQTGQFSEKTENLRIFEKKSAFSQI